MMTREKYFLRKSKRRWYCLAGLFRPYWFDLPDGKPCVGCQLIGAIDFESQYFIGQWCAGRAPASVTAPEVIAFIEQLCSKHGKPKVGFYISCSVWYSSNDLYSDPDTRDRVIEARDAGLSWPAMSEADRSTVARFLQSRGLSVAWTDADVGSDLDAPRPDLN